jgi:hypothetical protein
VVEVGVADLAVLGVARRLELGPLGALLGVGRAGVAQRRAHQQHDQRQDDENEQQVH